MRASALVTAGVALLLLAGAPPASAVVGGEAVDEASVPWFVSIGSCGGTLVAPDRVLTAGHCVHGFPVPELGARVGLTGATRVATRFAMRPGWQRANGENVVEDVAIVQLDAPVEGVPPVTLGGSLPDRATIIGTGLTLAPGTRGERERGLRGAELRLLSDTACARAFRRRRGNGNERFFAAQMLCAIDVDGRAPLSSGCNGDSGGALWSGPSTAPVIHGVVSWGGARCGADRLPSVFGDVRRDRGFITDADPVWAPAATGPSRITGSPRVGATLRCATSWSVGPTTTRVTWQRQGGGRPLDVGRRASYRVRRVDAGKTLACSIEGRTAGGASSAPIGDSSFVRVPR